MKMKQIQTYKEIEIENNINGTKYRFSYSEKEQRIMIMNLRYGGIQSFFLDASDLEDLIKSLKSLGAEID